MTGCSIRAAICPAPGERLYLDRVRLARPAHDEVLIGIRACAICQSDISYADGHWGGFADAVFGHEAAGIAEAVGAGVNHIKPGDHVIATLIRSCGRCRHCVGGSPPMCDNRVDLGPKSPLCFDNGRPILQAMGTGAFAEKITVHGSQTVKIPNSLGFQTASTIACAVITGYGAVMRDGGTRAGDRVAVIGAGGVGLNIIQSARLRNAAEIIAIDRQAGKLEDARRFGASLLIDASSMDVADRVASATGGQGVDQVYVSVGAQVAVDQGLTLLGKSGSLVIVGIPADGAMTRFDTVRLNSLNQRIIGSKMGGARIRQDVPAIVEHYKNDRYLLDELISQSYPLEEINEAIDAARAGKAIRNVITP